MVKKVGGWNVTSKKHWLGEGILMYAREEDEKGTEQIFVPIDVAIRLQNSVRRARKEVWYEEKDFRKRPYRLVKSK